MVVADVPGVGLMSFESWSMICVIASLLALNCLLLDFPFYVGVEGLKADFSIPLHRIETYVYLNYLCSHLYPYCCISVDTMEMGYPRFKKKMECKDVLSQAWVAITAGSCPSLSPAQVR